MGDRDGVDDFGMLIVAGAIVLLIAAGVVWWLLG